jgi:hypothetical protein
VKHGQKTKSIILKNIAKTVGGVEKDTGDLEDINELAG